MLIEPKHALRGHASDIEKSQFPGDRSAISGLRYYSPGTGRWLSRDPIAEKGGLNIYAAADNDSLNHVDALGLLVQTFDRATVTTRHVDALGPVDRMPGKSAAGDTRPTTELRWVRIHPINDCCQEILIDAKMSIAVRIVGDMDDFRGRNGISTIEHEMRHVDQIAQAWNAYAKIANSLEGKWCGAGCAESAARVESAAYTLYLAQVDYRGQAFDSWEYDKPWGDEEQRFTTAFAKLAIEAGKLISSCKKQ